MLRSKNKVDKTTALAFFNLNTEIYPGSFNAFDSLGEAYDSLGETEKAIVSYEKSLALNPNNEHAKMKVENLKNSK